jgi:hypothetical protein
MTGVERMKRLTTILLALAVGLMFVSQAVAKDTGKQDVLRLLDGVSKAGEFTVEVHVVNDEALAGLDIPLRFGAQGDGIELLRVDFSERVEGWDFTHAAIDNQEKTVILGLISELTGTRVNADLKISANGGTKIADLVFKVEAGYEASFETFTTERPGHELTYIYNRDDGNGSFEVVSLAPEFEVDVTYKNSILPSTYALSQNFPNPFNPSTSFTLSLPEASDYQVRVFNITGQLVKSFDGNLEAGNHSITWHGDNNQGVKVASGVYFYRAVAGIQLDETRKMLMLK